MIEKEESKNMESETVLKAITEVSARLQSFDSKLSTSVSVIHNRIDEVKDKLSDVITDTKLIIQSEKIGTKDRENCQKKLLTLEKAVYENDFGTVAVITVALPPMRIRRIRLVALRRW